MVKGNNFHILGKPETFAIEWGIATALVRPSQLALGCFVIHVNGRSFGVRDAEATLLACSYDEVKRRVKERGTHEVNFWSNSASDIVKAFTSIKYKNIKKKDRFLGMLASKIEEEIMSKRIQWAPDGDAAFDDSSHVLQIDHAGCVRLIAFKNFPSDEETALSVVEAWTSEQEFYGLLSGWLKEFETEREILLRRASMH